MQLRYAFDCALHRILKILTWFLCHSYFWLRVEGRENVPRKGPVLIASSHSSFLDPVIAGMASPRILCYMARDSLFRPPLKWMIEHLFAYPISRDSSDLKALRQVNELLAKNRAVLLFPEGTRSRDGAVGSFKPGIGLLALRTGVPVVPLYLGGTFQSWPRHGKFPKPARLQAIFGKPLRPEDYKDVPKTRQGFEQIAQILEKQVKDLEKQAGL